MSVHPHIEHKDLTSLLRECEERKFQIERRDTSSRGLRQIFVYAVREDWLGSGPNRIANHHLDVVLHATLNGDGNSWMVAYNDAYQTQVPSP